MSILMGTNVCSEMNAMIHFLKIKMVNIEIQIFNKIII